MFNTLVRKSILETYPPQNEGFGKNTSVPALQRSFKAGLAGVWVWSVGVECGCGVWVGVWVWSVGGECGCGVWTHLIFTDPDNKAVKKLIVY